MMGLIISPSAEQAQTSLWGLRTECPVSGPINQIIPAPAQYPTAFELLCIRIGSYADRLLPVAKFVLNPTGKNSIDVQPEPESVELV